MKSSAVSLIGSRVASSSGWAYSISAAGPVALPRSAGHGTVVHDTVRAKADGLLLPNSWKAL